MIERLCTLPKGFHKQAEKLEERQDKTLVDDETWIWWSTY